MHRFSYLSEVGAKGLLNFFDFFFFFGGGGGGGGWKAFKPSRLGKLELECHFKWIENHIRN